MILYSASPNAVKLSDVEWWRIQRARIAEKLHMEPARVDAMAYEDVCDLLELWRADEVNAERKAKLQRRRR